MQVTSAISYAKQLLDTVFYKGVEQFLARSGELNQVISLLADGQSKQ